MCGRSFASSDFERRVTIAFIVESERVVILRVFYGGADWQDDLA